MNNFELALASASKRVLDKEHQRFEVQQDLRTFKELSGEQVLDLARRILVLPDDDIAILIFHYVYNVTYDGIAELLKQGTIMGKMRYVEHILSSGMGLLEDEGIGAESMRGACEIALEEYTRVESPGIGPKYSRRFVKKMRELKVIRDRSLYIRVLQKVAIVFIVLSVSFGTALGVNAEFRERVFNWFTETFPQFSEFRLGTGPEAIEVTFEQLLLFRPVFIPDGFQPDLFFEAYPLAIFFEYSNSYGDRLFIAGHMPEHAIAALSAEGADVEVTSFRGEEAFYWEVDGIAYFVFVLDGYHFNIIGQIDRQTIMQIAESIKIP